METGLKLRAATAEVFRRWRTEMGISVEQAATMLGKKVATAYAYQAGDRQLTKTTLILMSMLAERQRVTHK
jgi:predicted transcriptional regulator